jgi:hypothetical protein
MHLDFTIYYLLPLVLHQLVAFFRTRALRPLMRAGIVALLSAVGNYA